MPGNHDEAHSAEYLTEAEAAALLRVGRRSLERWRVSGDGPAWVRMGPRRVLYPRAALVAWAEARTYPHRAAELARKVAA
jgi:excisionase family DNA binding protein